MEFLASNSPRRLVMYWETGFHSTFVMCSGGFLNLVLGYSLFVRSKIFNQSLSGKVVFFAGVLGMGIFLSYVFSR